MKDDRNCASCKYWDRSGRAYVYYDPEANDDVDTSHRICLRVPHGNTYPPAEPQPAFVVDGSGYMAELWTGPTFCCSLWEEKP